MKRDMILLVLCLCVLAGIGWLNPDEAVPTAAIAQELSLIHISEPTRL